MGKTLKNTNQEENSKAPEKHIWKGGLKVFLIMALSVAQEHLAGYIRLNCYTIPALFALIYPDLIDNLCI